jgi:Asp-tRNA(Asn)/Glu-tRNA(Gln) amidotransferase A subunit family amidase
MAVGDPVYSDVPSNTLSPAFALPLLQIDGLPLGVQLIGLPDRDYELARHSRWLSETYLA